MPVNVLFNLLQESNTTTQLGSLQVLEYLYFFTNLMIDVVVVVINPACLYLNTKDKEYFALTTENADPAEALNS
jgi:hypothetical protein